MKKHCTIGVVSPPSFMRRIVLVIFWAEYWGRLPGWRMDIQKELMGGAAGADWALIPISVATNRMVRLIKRLRIMIKQ